MKPFEPGQTIQIRSWDDMKAEFGVTESGSIACEEMFIREMKYLCGRYITVPDDYDPTGPLDIDGFTISADMIEPTPETLPTPQYLAINITFEKRINYYLSLGYTVTHASADYAILQRAPEPTVVY